MDHSRQSGSDKFACIFGELYLIMQRSKHHKPIIWLQDSLLALSALLTPTHVVLRQLTHTDVQESLML